MILRDQGDLQGALHYIQRALGILERVYGPDHSRTKTTAESLKRLQAEARA